MMKIGDLVKIKGLDIIGIITQIYPHEHPLSIDAKSPLYTVSYAEGGSDDWWLEEIELIKK